MIPLSAPDPGFQKCYMACRISMGVRTPGFAGSAVNQLIQGPLEMRECCHTELKSPLDHLKIAVPLFGMCELPEPQTIWLRKG